MQHQQKQSSTTEGYTIICHYHVPVSTFIGGPYGVFAGRDASRGLATFSLTEDVIKDEYDDLSDLNSMQMDSIREWEMQFQGENSPITWNFNDCLPDWSIINTFRYQFQGKPQCLRVKGFGWADLAFDPIFLIQKLTLQFIGKIG